MKLILHIGQPKTGSTNIQSSLQRNKDLLLKYGYLYETDSLNHQSILQQIKQSDNIDLEIAKFAEKQIKKAEANNAEAIILSSEAYFAEENEFLEKLIKSFNMESKVILYLKRQDLYLESAWKQWHFKNKHYKDFDDYTEKIKLEDYFNVLEKWSKLVGSTNISLTPFEKRNFKNGLIKHFFQTVGLEESQIDSLDFNIPKNMFGTNQGLSPKGLKFAYLVKDIADGPLDYKIENFIHKYLGDVFHKQHFESYGLFSLDKRKKYMEFWKGTNQKVSIKYLNRETLFLDDIVEDKADIDITLEDITKVVMTLGIKFDEKLNIKK